jgi:hypothetical protein
VQGSSVQVLDPSIPQPRTRTRTRTIKVLNTYEGRYLFGVAVCGPKGTAGFHLVPQGHAKGARRFIDLSPGLPFIGLRPGYLFSVLSQSFSLLSFVPDHTVPGFHFIITRYGPGLFKSP